MPELPEVETVRRGLEPAMTGRRFARVLQRRPDLRFPFPPRFVARLTGRTVTRLGRRAKYLTVTLDDGAVLIVHLGMSGRILIHPGDGVRTQLGSFHQDAGHQDGGAEAFDKHDHVVFDLDDGTRIIFNDHRRFGFMDLTDEDALDAHPAFARLGPEPLGNAFSAAHLDTALMGKRTPVKAALLDQRIVAGLGNIYVCEALWRAGISPRRQALSIPGIRAQRLAPVIRQVLEEAIVAGGSSLRDYRHTDGELGYFQHSFAVYDREGEPCRTQKDEKPCGGTIGRIVQAGRSTFFCPRCQR